MDIFTENQENLLCYDHFNSLGSWDIDLDVYPPSPEYIRVYPEDPITNTLYFEKPLSDEKINVEQSTLSPDMIKSILNESANDVNIDISIKLLKKRLPFKLFLSTDGKMEFFGNAVEVQKNPDAAKSKTKFFLITDADGNRFKKLHDLRKYLMEKYKSNNICTMMDVFYHGEDGKPYALKSLYDIKIRSGESYLDEKMRSHSLPQKTDETKQPNRKKRRRRG